LIMPRDLVFLLCASVVAFAAGSSYLVSRFGARIAVRLKAVDEPTGGRKIHTTAIPLWGGFGIAISILIAVAVLYVGRAFVAFDVRLEQLLGFAIAIVILCVGGMIDDRRPLPPWVQLLFPILGSIVVIASGTGIVQVTNPAGGAFSLTRWIVGPVSLPADVLTLAWLLIATYATKFLDGLDGLVTGIAVIGSGIVGALTLSPTYYQPAVAFLAATVGGGFLGFLPRNIHPAKQFLGESGSTIAGFSLGFLAIVSSTKVAIALAVLAIPVVDAAVVLLGRIVRGEAPWKGDDTHLHFRLLRVGIPHRKVVILLWAVSFVAGMMALSLQTRGKLFLVAMLAVLTILASWMAQRIARRRSSS
jgi:UDP-GlcNAc:undecaprenyl-phosphate GlcNAc-1-phosphate transferase